MQTSTNPWSQDFALNPWLDRPDAQAAIEMKRHRGLIDDDTSAKLLYWHNHGYLILPGIIDDARIEALLADFEQFHQRGTIVGGHRRPVTRDAHGRFEATINVHMQSDALKDVFLDATILDWLGLILGKPVYGCQTINFFSGSGRALHQDHVHMTTRPLGYLAASWIALEDIHPESGPLLYAPGSQWLPFLNAAALGAEGEDPNETVARRLSATLAERNMATEKFIAKKGDVLLWHANLAHGGAPVENQKLSRLSVACHYIAFGVDYYHDLSGLARDPSDVLLHDGRPYLPEYYDDNGSFAPTYKAWQASRR